MPNKPKPNKAKSSKGPTVRWSGEDVLQWLERHPNSIEPGLDMAENEVVFPEHLDVPLCATDGLGRPCLFYWVTECDASFIDNVLSAVSFLKGDSSLVWQNCTRPQEPRVFLLTSVSLGDSLERLELLSAAFPLRAYRVSFKEQTEKGSPSFSLFLPRQAPQEDDLLAALSEGTHPHVRRFLRSMETFGPTVSLHAPTWPMVFQGQYGPCLTLYQDQGQCLAAYCVEDALQVFMFDDEEQIDRAIDLFMRELWNVRVA